MALLKQPTEDYYAILEVEQSASIDEIIKAYRRLALMEHPDRSKDPNATQKFQKIQAAHEILTDENKRRKYDKTYVSITLTQAARSEPARPPEKKHNKHEEKIEHAENDKFGYCSLILWHQEMSHDRALKWAADKNTLEIEIAKYLDWITKWKTGIVRNRFDLPQPQGLIVGKQDKETWLTFIHTYEERVQDCRNILKKKQHEFNVGDLRDAKAIAHCEKKLAQLNQQTAAATNTMAAEVEKDQTWTQPYYTTKPLNQCNPAPEVRHRPDMDQQQEFRASSTSWQAPSGQQERGWQVGAQAERNEEIGDSLRMDRHDLYEWRS